MKNKVIILKNEVFLETETFVESDELKGTLKCEYSVEMEYKVLIINEEIIRYEWYKGGVQMDGEKSQYLFFNQIDQKLNGTYECRIILKNKQTIQSQQFDLIVYKCKNCPFCYHQELSLILLLII